MVVVKAKTLSDTEKDVYTPKKRAAGKEKVWTCSLKKLRKEAVRA